MKIYPKLTSSEKMVYNYILLRESICIPKSNNSWKNIICSLIKKKLIKKEISRNPELFNRYSI